MKTPIILLNRFALILFFLVLLLFLCNGYSTDNVVKLFLPYNPKAPESYEVYHPGEIVKNKGNVEFQCMRTVSNATPLPTFENIMTDTFWKLNRKHIKGSPVLAPNFIPWNGATIIKYVPGDYVRYNNIIYKCIKEAGNNFTPPTLPKNWTFASYSQTFFIKKMGIPDFPVLDKKNSNFIYFSPKNIVSYNGELYKCIREVSNAKTPDKQLDEYWLPYTFNNNQNNKYILLILVNHSSYRTPIILKLFNTAKQLGYQPILLTDNLNSESDDFFSAEAIKFYTGKGFDDFKNQTEKNIFVSSNSNMINMIIKYQPKLIYYLGDGECNNAGDCIYIDSYGGFLTPSDIKSIKFAKNTSFIGSICHGANKPFGLAVYNAGVQNYAAGLTYMDDFTSPLIGLGVFTNLLLGIEFEKAFKIATTDLQNLFKKHTAQFQNGAWGYYVNRSDFYNYQLYNYNSSNPNYHNKLFTNYKAIYSNKNASAHLSSANWPFKPNGQNIISTPSIGTVTHTDKVTVVE